MLSPVVFTGTIEKTAAKEKVVLGYSDLTSRVPGELPKQTGRTLK